MEQLRWLAMVRHGQSTGNVIAEQAEVDGLEVIDIPERDADVALSELGREQARAVGAWLAGRTEDERPTVVVVSPYLRARQTADLALTAARAPVTGAQTPVTGAQKPAGGGRDPVVVVDERLRDRELGVLDLLTGRGVEARLPHEAARRKRLGKFYYRPPGGESWADVLLRLRALLREIREDHPGARVLFVAHDATALMLRYLVEGLSEAELMDLAHRTSIANCSISSWRRDEQGELRPEQFNAVDHLHRADTPPTRQENVDAEPV
ncbi:histidine phosphatase family protein [Micromonosporaceae bacterium Da 78-11]